MLSKLDDYPVHQTAEPLAQPATTDRNVYDRYWFNGYDPDGEFYFGIGLGVYPNRGIMDCGFSIVRDGEQHAFHASRRAPSDPTETQVGPFRIEILEPMRTLRVVIDANETGIDCDLRFTARTACFEEGRQTLRDDRRVIMDSTRFAQFGCWEGRVGYAGQELRVDGQRVRGTKDRSWGLRPVGEPDAGGAPASRLPQVFFLWAPIHWEDHCTHFGIFEDERGRPWHTDAAVIPAYASPAQIPGVVDPGVEAGAELGHRLVYAPGTRLASSAEIRFRTTGESAGGAGSTETGGEDYEITLEPLLCFRMKGIGYMHPEWGHGRWQGELAVAGESWKTEQADPLALDNQHVQQVMRARRGDQVGVGVMEQLCLGPHATYGFTELLDGAK